MNAKTGQLQEIREVYYKFTLASTCFLLQCNWSGVSCVFMQCKVLCKDASQFAHTLYLCILCFSPSACL